MMPEMMQDSSGNAAISFVGTEAHHAFHGFKSLHVPMSNPFDVKETPTVKTTLRNDLPTSAIITGGSKKLNPLGRVGRRGDQRMHKAMRARQANPNLTLVDALLAGGFAFPNLDAPGLSDRTIKDTNDVSLCQRKNQLMRRLRMAKNDVIITDVGGTAALISDALKKNKTGGSTSRKTKTKKTPSHDLPEHSVVASSATVGPLQGQHPALPVMDQYALMLRAMQQQQQQQSTQAPSNAMWSGSGGNCIGNDNIINNNHLGINHPEMTASINHHQNFAMPSANQQQLTNDSSCISSVVSAPPPLPPTLVASNDPYPPMTSSPTGEASDDAASQEEPNMELSLQNFIDFFVENK